MGFLFSERTPKLYILFPPPPIFWDKVWINTAFEHQWMYDIILLIGQPPYRRCIPYCCNCYGGRLYIQLMNVSCVGHILDTSSYKLTNRWRHIIGWRYRRMVASFLNRWQLSMRHTWIWRICRSITRIPKILTTWLQNWISKIAS